MRLQKQRVLKKKPIKFECKKQLLKNIFLKKKLIQKENELKVIYASYQILQQENNRKMEFITHLSHEIKTPLSAISGFAELLKDENLSKIKQDRFLKNILCASNHILRIVDYTLEIAKVESGKMQLDYINFSPTPVIREILSILDEWIKTKNIKVETNFVKTEIIADKHQFKQLIYNMVSNAIKFNRERGTICISTEIIENDFFFKICDTGIGIPYEEKYKIFDYFSSINTKENLGCKSSGVGLALCKKIVEFHNGKIDFSSKVEQGSCFWFCIPVKPYF